MSTSKTLVSVIMAETKMIYCESKVLLLHSRNTYTTIHIYTQKHSRHNNDERTHVFRKIYLSHYSKGLRKGYLWEVSWRLNKDCNILTLSSFVLGCISFSFCWAAQPGALRAHLSAGSGSHCLELQQTESKLQTTRTSWGTGLYNCLTATCFSERCICT